MDHPLYEIVTTRLGAVSIRHKGNNEIMHNPVGPWAEANGLYIQQSHLEELLRQESKDPLVVFDVGLGAAANALAALHCAAAIPSCPRELYVISFERDTELLRFAHKNSKQFAHFHGYENAIVDLLEKGKWSSGGLHWELRHGDFLKLIHKEKRQPHLIFHDPYSAKSNPEMWTVECFKLLRQICREDSLLLTYSQATPVRENLLLAGFYVGQGTESGPKEETTQAAPQLGRLKKPLGKEWLGRWTRSSQQSQDERLREFVRKHPQFI